MPRIKFLKKGQWADPAEERPRKVFKSEVGDIRDVSEQFAKNLVAGDAAEIIEELAPAPVQKAEKKKKVHAPVQKDEKKKAPKKKTSKKKKKALREKLGL